MSWWARFRNDVAWAIIVLSIYLVGLSTWIAAQWVIGKLAKYFGTVDALTLRMMGV